VPRAGTSLRQIGAFLGAEVNRRDIYATARRLHDRGAIKKAIAECGVLVFRNQTMSSERPQALRTICRRVTVHPFSTRQGKHRTHRVDNKRR